MNISVQKKKVFKVFILVISLILVLFNCSFLSACSDNDDSDKLRKQAIEHENYLLAQMQTIDSKYQITNRNVEEIVLQNYSLGIVDVYDTNGVDIGGYIIENHTIYHNWYEIEKNEEGILDIKFETVDRQENKNSYFSNNKPYIIHDRALSINLSPYNNFSFASANGDNEGRNAVYNTENSYKIQYEVKTNVTEFETTRIVNVVKGPWNSSHTEQFCTYEIKFIKIIFEDLSYNNATIMEYRFTVQTFVDEEYDELFDSYND